jgi:glycosyltransferase EpsE
MTAYNCSKFVEESIVSIMNQTYKNFEFIFYDDGSTDGSYDIAESVLKKFQIPYIMLRSNLNNGVGAGRNKAIGASSGQFIAIQDGDDISCPNRLEKEVECIEGDGSLFCVSSGITKIDENGHILYPMKQPEKHSDIVKKMLKSINAICDPSCIYRKDIFNAIGGYRENAEILYVPDWDLWCRAALLNHKFYNIQDCLVQYRLHPGSNCYKYLHEIVRQHYTVYKDFPSRFNRGMLKEIFTDS